MAVGFVKYLPFARMDCTVPRFIAQCSQCAVSCDPLRFGCILSDSVKCKGAHCVQGIEYAAQNRQKRKKLCAAYYRTQHRTFLCCRFLIVFTPLFFLSCFILYHQQRQLQNQRGMCLNDTYPFCQQPLSGNCHSICFSKSVLWTATPRQSFFRLILYFTYDREALHNKQQQSLPQPQRRTAQHIF